MENLSYAEFGVLKELSKISKETKDKEVDISCNEIDEKLELSPGDTQSALFGLRDLGKISIVYGEGIGNYRLKVLDPVIEFNLSMADLE